MTRAGAVPRPEPRAVAVLRPEPGNARTAAAVAAMGLVPIRLPLFAIVPVAWTVPDPGHVDAIVATSANAFRHGGAGLATLTALPVIAVGAATAAAARAAGFTVEATGVADASALTAAVAGRRVLHLAGRDHRPVNGAAPAIVYAADPLPVDAGAIEVLAGQVALLHSARAARRLAHLVDPARRATIRLATLSPAVADAADDGWAGVFAAALPRDAALLALAADLAAQADAGGTIDRAARREDNRGR